MLIKLHYIKRIVQSENYIPANYLSFLFFYNSTIDPLDKVKTGDIDIFIIIYIYHTASHDESKTLQVKSYEIDGKFEKFQMLNQKSARSYFAPFIRF